MTSARPGRAEAQALQVALAAEHAALAVLALLGARTSQSAEPDLHATLVAVHGEHRGRRDQLQRELRDLGVTPVRAAPAYELPSVDSVDRVAAEALAVERRCAETYAWLVGQTEGSRRRWALGALTKTAVRELAFRGTPEMFPGVGKHADR